MDKKSTARDEDLLLLKTIGRNLRYLRRKTLKQKKNQKNILSFKRLSQSDIAKILNVSFQQIQKYETGYNQIPITKLNIISNFFKIPINFLCHIKLEKMPFSKKIDAERINEIEYRN